MHLITQTKVINGACKKKGCSLKTMPIAGTKELFEQNIKKFIKEDKKEDLNPHIPL